MSQLFFQILIIRNNFWILPVNYFNINYSISVTAICILFVKILKQTQKL